MAAANNAKLRAMHLDFEYWGMSPEAGWGVSEVGGAVKVFHAEATPNVVHAGQSDVIPGQTSPQGALGGPITEGHPLIVVFQTTK